MRHIISTLLLLLIASSNVLAQGAPLDLLDPGLRNEAPVYAQRYEPRYEQQQYQVAPRQVQQNPALRPATVNYPDLEEGIIVIDSRVRRLYLGIGNHKAIRYAIGVGRQGMGWGGEVRVGAKQEWPTWTPPAEMRTRVYRTQGRVLPESMPGGINNPLGARALYLFDGGRDTLYRIHGTNEPETIGQAMSSGCFRMMNEDVIDLYQRVQVGTTVYVIQ